MGFLSKLFRRGAAPAAPESASASVAMLQVPVESDYERLRREANSLLNKGALEQAILAYETAAHVAPELAEAHVNLGYALAEVHRHDDATRAFSRAVELDENNFDAYFLMASSKLQLEEFESALESVQRALVLAPRSRDGIDLQLKLYALADDVSGIELCLRKQIEPMDSPAEQLVEFARGLVAISAKPEMKKRLIAVAVDHVEAALSLQPEFDEALNFYGFLLIARGDSLEAIRYLNRAIALNPGVSDYHCNLGSAYQGNRQLDLARNAFEAALKADAKCSKAHLNLGDLDFRASEWNKAISHFRQALAIDPQSVDVHVRLSSVYGAADSLDHALQFANSAVDLAPTSPGTHYCRANVFAAGNRYNEAAEDYRKALALWPDYVDAKVNLGATLLNLGQCSNATELFEQALHLAPDSIAAASNLAYCASFDPACSPEDYLRRANVFGKLATARATAYTHNAAAPDPHSPLKVGLVSGDFCLHPVGLFLESVLALVDTDRIEFHAFSNRERNDALALGLRPRFSSWTSIVDMDDATAAKSIYDAQLDLLIDLSGHTDKNRLCLFSWRPAPVQATWLGYWASTGVAEIDYILTDRHTAPPSMADAFTEKAWCLGDTRLCFTVPTAAYDLLPGTCPGLSSAHITFGCYQPLRKLTDTVFDAWGEIFKQVPGSHFRMQGSNFTSAQTTADILKRLQHVGIPEDHVALFDMMGRIDYLKSHAQVDIILDSFPYPGGTTTCDALWMGVPTVTLAGASMLSRQGAGMMLCAGLSDWVANDVTEYIAIAVKHAQNIPNLERTRKSLRQQVLQSPLFDALKFTKNLETSLRALVLDKLVHH